MDNNFTYPPAAFLDLKDKGVSTLRLVRQLSFSAHWSASTALSCKRYHRPGVKSTRPLTTTPQPSILHPVKSQRPCSTTSIAITSVLSHHNNAASSQMLVRSPVSYQQLTSAVSKSSLAHLLLKCAPMHQAQVLSDMASHPNLHI